MKTRNILVCLAAFTCWDAFPALATPHKAPHYSLVMSKDDSVCVPLTATYNKLLSSYITKYRPSYLPSPKNLYAGGWRLNFEALDPKKLESIGLVLPPTQTVSVSNTSDGSDTHTETVSLVDLFGEGKPRIISYAESLSSGGAISSTEMKVLKRNAEYREVQKNEMFAEIDPEIVDRDATFEGLMKDQNDPAHSYLGYVLREWPNFEQRYKEYMTFLSQNVQKPAPKKSPQLPSIEQPTSAALLMHADRPYFVLNGYIYMPGLQDSYIDVYQLTSFGHEDVCYIHLPR